MAIPIDKTNARGRSAPYGRYVEEDPVPGDVLQYWYAIRTRSRHEKVTSLYLERWGFEVFLPLVDRIRQWKDGRVHVQFPLFPGYCFIRCSIGQHRQVKMRVGAVELVGVAGRAIPVPLEEARLFVDL